MRRKPGLGRLGLRFDLPWRNKKVYGWMERKYLLLPTQECNEIRVPIDQSANQLCLFCRDVFSGPNPMDGLSLSAAPLAQLNVLVRWKMWRRELKMVWWNCVSTRILRCLDKTMNWLFLASLMHLTGPQLYFGSLRRARGMGHYTISLFSLGCFCHTRAWFFAILIDTLLETKLYIHLRTQNVRNSVKDC